MNGPWRWSAAVAVPARTVRLTLATLGALGALSACGPATVDHTPAGNLLDADTEDLEGGLGHWQAWYSTHVTRSTDSARRGRASLRIAITAPDGWGVQLDNWPGYPATPGRHRIELWARTATGSALDLNVSLRWRNEAGADLQTDVVKLRPDGAWQSAGRDLDAPSATTRVSIELTGHEGGPGDTLEVDEVFVL
jgi:hypothetical protein